MGFDPKHEKYNSYSRVEIMLEIERIDNMIRLINEKINGKDELRDKRFRISIFDLNVERRFLIDRDLVLEEYDERRDAHVDDCLEDMRSGAR